MDPEFNLCTDNFKVLTQLIRFCFHFCFKWNGQTNGEADFEWSVFVEYIYLQKEIDVWYMRNKYL